MATNEYTYEQIVRDLKARKYAPVYFLMGEEDYYIDRISEIIEESVLAEEEKDFNLSILYGLDYADQYRHLPYIGVLKPEVYQQK